MTSEQTASSRHVGVNRLAVASVLLGVLAVVLTGIASLLGAFWALPPGVAAIVLGGYGVAGARARHGRGLTAAILGVVLGALPFLTVFGLLLLNALGDD